MNFQEWKMSQVFADGHPDQTCKDIPAQFLNEPEVQRALKSPTTRSGGTRYVLPDGVYLFPWGVEAFETLDADDE